IDYVECVTFSMQTSMLFLLQCFWNYLSDTVAKKTFMGSNEFKFYIVWALSSVALFPLLQWWYKNNVLLREIVPQLTYSCEVLIVVFLGIRSHVRFSRIVGIASRTQGPLSAVVLKMSYFKQMNLLLTLSLASYGVSLFILCIDGLTEKKTINSNKFASDFLVGNCDVAIVFIWLCIISIFHPRRSLEQQRTQRSGSQALHTELGSFPTRHEHSARFLVSRFNVILIHGI
ncbi:hypothetical protein BDF14DRAFT_1731167, partial [Spinellus fusiger]